MSLRERLEASNSVGNGFSAAGLKRKTIEAQTYRDLKMHIHRALIDRIDLQIMDTVPKNVFQAELKNLVEDMLVKENVAINESERKDLVRDIQYEMLGLGPLELLMTDPSISDILINTHKTVYVERFGKLELTDISFNDDAHLMKIIDKIVSRIGRRVDESSPMVDARLPDGSRVNVIIPPLSIDGPVMSIRRFAVVPLTMKDYIGYQTLSPDMALLLEGLASAKINMVISGGTGTGKTTLLNILSGFIGANERIITIEDAAELQLQQPHIVRLETRPPNIEGVGDITQRMLVRNALRMRPDRIILGEVRGEEAIDMLQAMNTGHEGSMVTVHANSPRDGLTRIENMISMGSMNLPTKVARHQISSALTVIMQVSRMADGKRKLVSIQEITGMEGDIITMQEIFSFKQTGVAANGAVEGYFCATGVRPRFADLLRIRGVDLPDSLFNPTLHYEVTA